MPQHAVLPVLEHRALLARAIEDAFGRSGYLVWATLYPLALGAGCSALGFGAFRRGDRPYISSDAPEEAYILCNLDPNAPVRIGTLMPSTSPM